MGKIVDWFEGRKPIQLTGYVYEASKHSGWGDALSWLDYDKRRVYGHLQRKPQVGDEIIFKMESGKIARYAVTAVEYPGDPRDMFFADVMDIGYENEPPLNKVREAKERQVEPRAEGLRLLI